jgi:transposase
MEALAPPRELQANMPDRLHACSTMLIQDDLFLQSASFREQLWHACRILRANLRPEVSYQSIGDMFGVAKSTVYEHVQNFNANGNMPGPVGRRSKFTAEQKNAIASLITFSWQTKKLLRLGDLKNIIANEWGIVVDRVTLYRTVRKDRRLRTVTGKPMENGRMEVAANQIENYFTALDPLITGCPAHFVFNLDEMGYQAYADRVETTFVVPSICQDEFVYYPVSRRGKRITLIACIAADGSFMRPAVIIARKTWEHEFEPRGLTAEKLTIYSQSHSFINGSIFEDWFANTFCPDLERRREIYDYWGPACLILDGCTSHRAIDKLCEGCGVQPIFLPPHSSNQLQPLDLCFFGLVKGYISRMNDCKTINFQSSNIVKVATGFYKSADPCSIVASFQNAGISLVYDPEDHQTYCVVTKDTCRCLMQPPTISVNDSLNPQQHIDLDTVFAQLLNGMLQSQ